MKLLKIKRVVRNWILQFDTSDGTGDNSFQSSPALGGTEVSNAFYVTVTKNDDDSLSACALQGHGLSPVDETGAERSSATGADDSIYRVRGFYCMKGQQNGTQSFGEDLSQNQFDTQFAYVQKQCFSLTGDAWSLGYK